MELLISNLSCQAENENILNGVDLEVNKGDCLALLGPNGHGKSTLLNVIMSSPNYKVTGGSITFEGKDITSLSADQKSKAGIFLAFQNPPDVPGVITMDFFKAMINSHREKPISLYEFYKLTTENYQKVALDSSMASRHLNESYSGGEKKRNEILQMLLLKPKLALLDEIDSGLDVDALAIIAKNIEELRKEGTTFIIVSHYDRLLNLLNVNKTAVMVNGKIALTGDKSLADRISKEGYSFLSEEYNIDLKKKKEEPVSIGVCATRVTK